METLSTDSTAFDILGGARILNASPVTLYDWIALVRQGFPSASAAELAKHLGLPLSRLADALAISPAKLGKPRKDRLLTSDQSARLLRIARIVERAAAVFESLEWARDWLTHPNRALGHVTPMSMLDTEFGAQEVYIVLGRIEHGIPF